MTRSVSTESRELAAGSAGPLSPVDEYCRRCQLGPVPDIVAYVRHESGPVSSRQLGELARVDQRARWAALDRVAAEWYFERFPELAADREESISLVYVEFLLREAAGEVPELEEFDRRFPQWASELREQVMLHRALVAAGGLPASAAADVDMADTEAEVGRLTTQGGSLRGPVSSDPPPASASHQPRAALPDVPGYVILEELGRGGMGVVYKARQIGLNRLVSLKMLLDGLHAGPDQMRRLRVEAEAVARLNHPQIVQIHEVGQHDGRPFLVLEYVSGGSLAAHCRGQVWPPREAAALIALLARAVHFAHSQGIVHRDLKPSNILLAEVAEDRQSPPRAEIPVFAAAASPGPGSAEQRTQLQPKISDFGLAKLAAEEGQGESLLRTRTGDILGTPAYMSPEQVTGTLDEVGPAADIYGLGTILYELLAGRAPFQGASPLEVIHKVLHEDAAFPARAREAIPRDLRTICLKCLLKDPNSRYGSAMALADDLQRFLAHEPIRARQVGRLERTWRWCRRNPVVSSLLAIVLLLLAVMAVVLPLTSEIRQQRDRALAAENSARNSLQRAIAAERDVKIQTLLLEARHQRTSGALGQRIKCLEAIRKAVQLGPSTASLQELRSEAIAAMGRTDLEAVWRERVPSLTGAQFDPSLEHVAVVQLPRYEMTVFRTSDRGEVLRTQTAPAGAWHAAAVFSPRGKYLLTGHWVRDRLECLLQVWDLNRGSRVHEQWIRSNDVRIPVAVHPNESWLLYCLPDDGLRIWDLAENREVKRLPLAVQPYNIVIDPEGRRVAMNEHVGQPAIHVFDLETGNELAAWRHHVGRYALTWSADGRLLASGTDDGRMTVWDVEKNELVSVLQGHSSAVIDAHFARHGSLLATTSWDGTTRIWDAVTGHELISLAGAITNFDLEDQRVGVVGLDEVSIWRVHGGTAAAECRILHPLLIGNHTEDLFQRLIYHVDISSDSRWMAVASGAGGVWIRDLEHGRWVQNLRHDQCFRVRFHPQDKCLLTLGNGGLMSWPLHHGPGDGEGELTIGDSQLLLSLSDLDFVDVEWLPGGSEVAVLAPDETGVRIVPMPKDPTGRPPASRLLSGRYDRMVGLSVSPDGRWLSAGGWKEAHIQVWDLATGRLAQELPIRDAWRDTVARVRFTPDGRWLSCSLIDGAGRGIGYEFWSTETWKPTFFVRASTTASIAAAFSASEQQMALSVADGEVSLARVADGLELARLTSPLPGQRTQPLAYAPQGDRLVLSAVPDTLLVWDLERLRRQLREIGLDWDAAPPIAAP